MYDLFHAKVMFLISLFNIVDSTTLFIFYEDLVDIQICNMQYFKKVLKNNVYISEYTLLYFILCVSVVLEEIFFLPTFCWLLKVYIL